jgi:hypothetical protein
MLGALPGDEEEAPNDDPPFDPPFDFFGLGQPANPPQFQTDLNNVIEEEQPDDINEWGPWLLGEANATPAAQLPQPDPLGQDHLIDLNLLVGEEDQHPMDWDLNEVSDQDFENDEEPIAEADNIDADQGQISMHISDAITLQYASSDTSVQGNLAPGMEQFNADLMEENKQQRVIVLGLTAQPNQPNLEHEGFFLPENLLQDTTQCLRKKIKNSHR